MTVAGETSVRVTERAEKTEKSEVDGANVQFDIIGALTLEDVHSRIRALTSNRKALSPVRDLLIDHDRKSDGGVALDVDRHATE